MRAPRLSPTVQAALQAAVTRNEVMVLLIAAGAPVKLVGDNYRVRADFLFWLSEALGLSDAVIFGEEV